jgi:hypothetical protein
MLGARGGASMPRGRRSGSSMLAPRVHRPYNMQTFQVESRYHQYSHHGMMSSLTRVAGCQRDSTSVRVCAWLAPMAVPACPRGVAEGDLPSLRGCVRPYTSKLGRRFSHLWHDAYRSCLSRGAGCERVPTPVRICVRSAPVAVPACPRGVPARSWRSLRGFMARTHPTTRA